MKMVLASKSPRRQEILRKYIQDFIIVESDFEEIMDDSLAPEALAMSLAYQKAADVQSQVGDQALILAADTIVVADRVLGKPKDRADAKAMIKSLEGKRHAVITGIALLLGEKRVVDYQMTQVAFAPMSEEEIEGYLNAGDYGDKAGAYGIQGYAEPFVEEIRGSYSNVVGLPVERLYQVLKRDFGLDLMKGMTVSNEEE